MYQSSYTHILYSHMTILMNVSVVRNIIFYRLAIITLKIYQFLLFLEKKEN